MASNTPQRRSLGRPRPSLGNSAVTIASSPNLASSLATSQRPPLPNSQLSSQRPSAFSRKASYGQSPAAALSGRLDGKAQSSPPEEGGSSPLTMYPTKPSNNRRVSDDKNGNQNLEVGDIVDVPGSMHGTIKFLGEVNGKKGHFAGVELSKEFARMGKNNGDVDGTRYFTTSIKGAGIFLPSSKAYKRVSSDSTPHTPSTPSLSAFSGGRADGYNSTPPTSTMSSKFSQSVGPGRAPSPALKPKSRPSLPRPESPLRKAQNAGSTPSNRPSIGAPKLSKSIIGAPRYAPSPTPGKFGASVRGGRDGDPGKRVMDTVRKGPQTPTNSRPQPRSNSRLGPEPLFDEESDNTPTGLVKPAYGANGTQQRSRPPSFQDEEIEKLRMTLEERDKQLAKYASDLEEMQSSITELQNVTPKHNSVGLSRSSRGSGIDELDSQQLRTLVREKNEKIATLTTDFDAHRAQFRNTIDSLERTSDETNRIYEQQVESLKQEIKELQDRGNDVESVAQQLKQLEELVAELEEGLEEARRGEAEASGEVEFLRGEVERTRSELRRERDKSAAALKDAGANMENGFSNGGSLREVEQRDDEIRGLKAIIHSLSRDAVPENGNQKHGNRRLSKQRHSGLSQANGYSENQLAHERQAREKLERDVKELEGLVDRKTYREEELEHEIERMRKNNAHVSSSSNGFSERTAVANSNHRPNLSKDSSGHWRELTSSEVQHRDGALESMPESDSHSTTMTDSSNLWCEMCESSGHEIFTCPQMQQQNEEPSPPSPHTRPDALGSRLSNDFVAPLSPARSPLGKSPINTPKIQQAKMPNPMDQSMVKGKHSQAIDENKWCALCERDGHESVDCPFDDDAT